MGAIGYTVGFFFFEDLASLGEWGPLLGFVLASLYFIPLNSRLGGGRTLGKRWAGTRVVGRDGRPVGVAPSAVRYVVLSFPVFLVNLPFLTTGTKNPLNILTSAFFGAVGWSIVYLVLFNRRTRQSLHDLVAGTYVIRDYWFEPAPITARIWKGHFVVIALLFVLAASMAAFFGQILPRLLRKDDSIRARIELYQKLRAEPEIASVDITWEKPARPGTRAQDEEDGENDLPVKIMLRQKPVSVDAEATKIAHIILRESAPARKKNEIAVTVGYGYDIGIARDSRSETITHSPAEWGSKTP